VLQKLLGYLLGLFFALVTVLVLIVRAPLALKDYLRYRRMSRMTTVGVT
jgi:hypothetical protein